MSQDITEPGPINQPGSIVSSPARAGLTPMQKIGIAGLLLVVFLGFIWLRYLGAPKSRGDEAREPETFSTGQDFRSAPPPVVTPPPLPASPKPALPLPAAFRPYPIMPTAGHHEMTPADSPIAAYSSTVPPLAANGGGAALAKGTADSPTALAVRLKPTVVEPTKTTLLPHPDFLLTEGTVIPCILQTAIDSQLPGYVKCVIPRDIRSTTGDVVLLDKGTQVIGEIQHGLMYGQNRIFVLWTRAETPQHAVVALDSPGTDELGRSGLPGAINNHFTQRFGSAIMLSVIEGGLQAGTALASNLNRGNRSNSLNFNSFSTNGQELANTALQASIQIPPTLEKNQGDTVAIFVARDLDFSDVYKLRATGYGDAR